VSGAGPGPAWTRPVWLHAVAFVDGEALGGPEGVRRWRDETDRPHPSWRLFFDDFPAFGRLDLASRYVLGAASRLPPLPEAVARRTAVVLGSRSGSLDADLRFARSCASRPSGRLYARTLPSVPASEVAIRLGLQGSTLSLVQDADPGVLALAAAAQEVEVGGADAAVAGGYEADESGVWAVVCLLTATAPARTAGLQVTVARVSAGPEPPQETPGLRDLHGLVHGPTRGGGRIELEGPTVGVRLTLSPGEGR